MSDVLRKSSPPGVLPVHLRQRGAKWKSMQFTIERILETALKRGSDEVFLTPGEWPDSAVTAPKRLAEVVPYGFRPETLNI